MKILHQEHFLRLSLNTLFCLLLSGQARTKALPGTFTERSRDEKHSGDARSNPERSSPELGPNLGL